MQKREFVIDDSVFEAALSKLNFQPSNSISVVKDRGLDIEFIEFLKSKKYLELTAEDLFGKE